MKELRMRSRVSTTIATFTVALAATMLAACGSTEPEPTPSADDPAFPVTVEHRLGSTTIPARPERVLTVGWNDQDFVTALGVVPVGTREWFEDYGDFAWVSSATGGADIPTYGDEIDYEAIAAARPDVILAIYEEFNEKVYDKLSKIAPTVLQPEEYGVDAMPWDEQTLLIGHVLGLDEEAEELVAEVDDRVEQVVSEHPEWADQTLAVDYGPNDGGHWLVPAGDPRRALFDALGFRTQEHEKDLQRRARRPARHRRALRLRGDRRPDGRPALPRPRRGVAGPHALCQLGRPARGSDVLQRTEGDALRPRRDRPAARRRHRRRPRDRGRLARGGLSRCPLRRRSGDFHALGWKSRPDQGRTAGFRRRCVETPRDAARRRP